MRQLPQGPAVLEAPKKNQSLEKENDKKNRSKIAIFGKKQYELLLIIYEIHSISDKSTMKKKLRHLDLIFAANN